MILIISIVLGRGRHATPNAPPRRTRTQIRTVFEAAHFPVINVAYSSPFTTGRDTSDSCISTSYKNDVIDKHS